MTDAVQPTTDAVADQTTYIAVGAAVGLLVLAACSVVLVVWLVKRKHSKQGLLTRIYMATLTHTCMNTVLVCVGDVPSSRDMRSFE